jgi:hypothetical protein
MIGGYRSIVLILNGLGLIFYPTIYFNGISLSLFLFDIYSHIWLVKSDILIQLSFFIYYFILLNTFIKLMTRNNVSSGSCLIKFTNNLTNCYFFIYYYKGIYLTKSYIIWWSK